ncbi:MAG: aspartate-semialdehyde dehydrogenase [Oscillospiraceae bacterium]|nr:aspartate-semialdehyde dehydrogenase [Oscillospiraceae bacterium]
MKALNIAVLGATGAVGQEMIKILAEYDIPVGELRPLASAKSVGKCIRFKGRDVPIREANDDAFEGLDFVLGAVEGDMSRRFAPAIKKSGAVYIDNSSAFRLEPDVPLVVPEINGADAFENRGIIANPNCCTVITLMAVAGIEKLSPIEKMIVCTYQAVSGAGTNGINELNDQMAALANGEKPVVKTFAHQIAMNVIPFIDAPYGNDYTKEEMKMQNEGRRIMHSPELKVNCTCVRVPVMRSHSMAVTLHTKEKVSVEAAKAAVAAYPGVRLIEDYEGRCYPTPLDTTDQDLVWVGRIREDITDEQGLTLWCCGDQIRKGAASNAVQILKLLAEKM